MKINKGDGSIFFDASGKVKTSELKWGRTKLSVGYSIGKLQK